MPGEHLGRFGWDGEEKRGEAKFYLLLPMKLKPKHKLVEHFSELEDPRIDRSKRHKLMNILTLILLADICGADSWVGIESFGNTKLKWLRRIVELPNGIPSHDTIAHN